MLAGRLEPDVVDCAAAAMSTSPSLTAEVRSPLQCAAAMPHTGDDPRERGVSSPWRGHGSVDAAALFVDDPGSLSSSIRSTRRRRGGDSVGSTAAEAKGWSQTLLDLERLQRENQERLQVTLHADPSAISSPQDSTFARTYSASSARSSVRRRRRGTASGASRGASAAPTEECSAAVASPASAGPVADFVEVTVTSDGSAAGTRASAGATRAAAAAAAPSVVVDDEGGITPAAPQRTSGLPGWLKRSAGAESRPDAAVPVETSPEHPPTSTADPPSRASALAAQRAHRDPVVHDGAPAPPAARRGSTSSSLAASPSAPSATATRLSTTVAAATAPAVRTTPASSAPPQPLAQTYTARHARAAAAAALGLAPASSPARSPQPVSPATSHDPAEAAAAAVPPATVAAAAVGGVVPSPAAGAAEEQPSGACVPHSRLPPQLAEVATITTTTHSGEAQAPSAAATPVKAAGVRWNASVSRVHAAGQDRPSSTMRGARIIRQDFALPRRSAGEVSRDGEERHSLAGPGAAAASVPRERRHSLVTHGARSASSVDPTVAPEGGDAPQPATGRPLHRTTALTELRRQEVLRDRFEREHRAAEEARVRVAAAQRHTLTGGRSVSAAAQTAETLASSRAANGEAVARSPSPRESSVQRTSLSLGRASALVRPHLSATGGAAVAAATPASSLRLSQPRVGATNSRRSGEELGVPAFSTTTRRLSASAVVSAPAAGTPKVNGGGLRPHAEASQSSSRPAAASTDGAAATRTVLGVGPHARAQPHRPSVAVHGEPTATPSPRSHRQSLVLGSIRRSEPRDGTAAAPSSDIKTEARSADTLLKGDATVAPASPGLEGATSSVAGAQTVAAGQPRPTPFCVECGQRHADDEAKFCALCGHKRTYLCC
ncbi:hypothetical protein NESM_000807900 [Novymonas esmeraldas]|uniref:Zinc-ribbon domain-containing protein n=1 Tax=Novymonas esmeraldas TaxID=1808958 RepID=A0AAW0EZA8_9TRYP